MRAVLVVTLVSNSDSQLAAKHGSSEQLQQLIEIVRNPVANASSLSSFALGKDDKARQSRDKKVSGYVVVYKLLLSVLSLFFLILKLNAFVCQATNQSISSREDYINIESMEPDPIGFREQVS